jgi:threonine synthase
MTESGGGGITVTDEEILSAIGRLARETGVFAEPGAAACLPDHQDVRHEEN